MSDISRFPGRDPWRSKGPLLIGPISRDVPLEQLETGIELRPLRPCQLRHATLDRVQNSLATDEGAADAPAHKRGEPTDWRYLVIWGYLRPSDLRRRR
jgi:hypothetical protein